MTEAHLKSIINKLNKKQLTEQLFLRPVKANVELGYYWDEKPKPTMSIASGDGPYQFYFIKNEDNRYIGLVLDMSRDLHWYILPQFRKQGYLSKALSEVILPHLFQSRKKHRITINTYQLTDKNAEASEAVALRTGFKPIGGMEYLLDKKDFKKIKIAPVKTNGISDERLEILRKKINYLSRSLWVVQNEVEMGLGKSPCTDKLGDLVDEIRKHTWKLEDAVWDFKDINNI